mmetsp:Transcript_20787/g.51930  ORF Transcript_20787/g.51930 Transcript_20787/m.51930 type:complete len:133 (+) Transcript_20787:245-643(+)
MPTTSRRATRARTLKALGVVRQRRAGSSCAGDKRKRAQQVLANECGDEWDKDEEFDAVILEMKISRSVKEDGHRKGIKLYHISWPGYSAAAATWEPEMNVGTELIEEWEAMLEAEAELDAEEARELEAEMED